jgi:hypothetical protein
MASPRRSTRSAWRSRELRRGFAFPGQGKGLEGRGSIPRSPWRPASDQELTWFRPPAGLLPARLTPADLAVTVPAFSFGISRALESLYFPLYELRAALFDGVLYLAAAPSEFAERDLAAQKRRLRDSALRFSRDIAAAWQRVRPEVEEYTQFFEAFDPSAIGPDAAARLRRVRANQWFASTRAVFAPAVLLREEDIGHTPPEVAARIVAEARTAVVNRGTAAFEAALKRLTPELPAVEATQPAGPNSPERIGPALAAGAPRMYMIQPLLNLIAGA